MEFAELQGKASRRTKRQEHPEDEPGPCPTIPSPFDAESCRRARLQRELRMREARCVELQVGRLLSCQG